MCNNGDLTFQDDKNGVIALRMKFDRKLKLTKEYKIFDKVINDMLNGN